MEISIQELSQIRREYAQVWPDDLVEDLEDSDPHVFEETQRQKELLATKRQEIEKAQQTEDLKEISHEPIKPFVKAPDVPKISVSPIQKVPSVQKKAFKPLRKEKAPLEKPKAPVFAPDTLVVRGWNDMRIKGKKNWSDFENLLYLYTLDKLFTAENMPEKAKQDKVELTYVVEEFDRLKRPLRKKHDSAKRRLAGKKTYIHFGKRTIDASCEPNPSTRAFELHDLEREYMDAMDSNPHNGKKLKKAYHIARRVIYNLRQRYRT